MPQKTIIIADPGIDTAFAIALALNDSAFEVVGALATGGNVSPDQATQNVRIILEQLDPPRWPRLGSAGPLASEANCEQLHGPGGLGGALFSIAKRDEPPAAEKVLVDLVRERPHECVILALGPLSGLAQALDRDPEIAALIQRIIVVGGVWRVAGDAGPVSEFHFASDPVSARRVLRCGAPITMIPLDVSRQLLCSPSELLDLPEPEARTCRFLRQIVPFGIRATANLHGVEGFHLCDVLGTIALARPAALTTRPAHVDVETRGELTRGMSVIDLNRRPANAANVELAIDVDIAAVRMYIKDVLASSI
jgi:inosine-uridine nucleoside N-ribohydrolase